MFLENPLGPLASQCEYHGRVSLKLHPAFETVHIEACYHSQLIGLGGLLLNYRCQCYDLLLGKSYLTGLGFALVVPESVTFLDQTVYQGIDRCVPVELVGVGYDHAEYRGGGVTQ